MADQPDTIDLKADEGKAPDKIDVLDDVLKAQEIPPHSPEWAKIVKPVAYSLLGLIAAVMLLPFVFVVFSDGEANEQVLDWAKTVLPPVVGFGGALVGYYFGTRGSQQGAPSDA